MDSDEKNKLCSNIKNILNDYEITCYDQLNPTQIDETVQNIFETLEQFYDNLNYSEIYELILNTVMEMDSDYEQDEQDEELETINVGPQTYDSLNELKDECYTYKIIWNRYSYLIYRSNKAVSVQQEIEWLYT